jgi:hypothetical protein
MKKFAYRVENCPAHDRDRILNDNGQDGWELIHYELDTGRCHMVFKREISDEPMSNETFEELRMTN